MSFFSKLFGGAPEPKPRLVVANAATKSATLMIAATDGDTVRVHALIAANENVDSQNADGFTALMCAANGGWLETVEALIAAGANVNARTTDGYTALIIAASKGDTEMIQSLIDAGANLNATNNHGFNALMVAARYCGAHALQALVTAGADVNATNADGLTAATIAEASGKADCAKILRDAGQRPVERKLPGLTLKGPPLDREEFYKEKDERWRRYRAQHSESWANEPATEAQIQLIKQLGGNLAATASKLEASRLIDNLLR